MKKKTLQNPTSLGKHNSNVLTEAQRKAYASDLGRAGGSKSSAAKTEAARKNGKLGGRPKKILEKGKGRKA